MPSPLFLRMASIASILVLLFGWQLPVDTAARLAQAASLLQAGHASQARDVYEAVLSAEPANVEAQQGEVAASERLALDARANRHLDDALRILLHARRFAPAQPKLLFDLGVLEDGMKLYWDADKTVAQLQGTAGGGDPQVLYLAARVKMDLGQLGLAEQEMRAYLKAAPGDATAHYGLGRILQLGQHPDEARAEYLKSLELQPRQTESHFQLGELALQQGQYDAAIAEYAKTLAGNPEHGGALAGTGIARFHLKQYDKAADMLRKAIAAAPEYQPGHYYLGLTLARLGLKAESDRELARAAAMASQDSQASAQRLRLQGAAAETAPPQSR